MVELWHSLDRSSPSTASPTPRPAPKTEEPTSTGLNGAPTIKSDHGDVLEGASPQDQLHSEPDDRQDDNDFALFRSVTMSYPQRQEHHEIVTENPGKESEGIEGAVRLARYVCN